MSAIRLASSALSRRRRRGLWKQSRCARLSRVLGGESLESRRLLTASGFVEQDFLFTSLGTDSGQGATLLATQPNQHRGAAVVYTKAGGTWSEQQLLRDPDGDVLGVVSVQTDNTLGNVSINGDGTITYDPTSAFDSLPFGEVERDSFVYVVSDPDGLTASGLVTLSVSNPPPQLPANGYGSLGGRVYVDVNQNGSYEPNEGDEPLGGVVMQLFGTTVDAQTLDLSVQTNLRGEYSFPVLPGTYAISQATQPSRFDNGIPYI
jgi:VCBS repeat-containing protein